MQADVLVELIRQATAGNQPAIRQSVERLIADEEQKGHRILAERLQKALQAPHTPSRTSPSPFSGQGGVAPQQALYYETQPARRPRIRGDHGFYDDTTKNSVKETL